ncbi:hypothetical protein ACPV5U_19075 [Vibrio mediterranei]
MNQHLDKMFSNTEVVKTKEDTISQEEDKRNKKAEVWYSKQEGLFNNVKHKLSQMPEGTSLKEAYKRMGIEIDTTSYSMKGGRVIDCDVYEFKGKEAIESATEVHPNNGRDQNDLTELGLNDVIDSIRDNGGNFLPAIGCWDEAKEKILALDGSRRRMSCILTDGVYRIHVARQPITMGDAKVIARILRLSKKLSYREQGAEYEQALAESDEMNDVADLAKQYGESEVTVRDKLNAYRLPFSLLEHIPAYNSMSSVSYKRVHSVYTKIQGAAAENCAHLKARPREKARYSAYLNAIETETDKLLLATTKAFGEAAKSVPTSSDLTEMHVVLIKVLEGCAVLKGDVNGKGVAASNTEHLVQYKNPDIQLTKKVTGKGKKLKQTYQFLNQPAEKIELLEKFIKENFKESS